MKGYRLSEKARADLQSIADYIATDNPAASARVVEGVEAAARLLVDVPFAGRSRDELQPDLRGFAVRPYTLFYQVRTDFVYVVRVLHQARDIEKALDESP